MADAKVDLKKIVSLLVAPDPLQRTSAAVVLGALGISDGPTVAQLLKLLDGSPDEQRAALDALARVGPHKAKSRALDLLASPNPAVREAAHRVLKACGPSELAEVVSEVKSRRDGATDVLKRELDRVLADLGGSNAFKALLDGLDGADDKTVHAAVLSVRERVLQADKRTRATYANAVKKALESGSAKSPHHEAALAKILGYCEDAEATALLITLLSDMQKATVVRQEAAIALRAALGTADAKVARKLVSALFQAAESGDSSLARTACDTLAAAMLDDSALPHLKALALHPNDDRARFAIEKLRTLQGRACATTLGEVVLLARKHIAIEARDALQFTKDAIEPTVAQLLANDEPDRTRLLAELLVARRHDLSKQHKGKLLEGLTTRLADEGRGYDALLAVCRAVDAEHTAVALRELAAKLKKQKKEERAQHVLILLSHTAGATDDDKFRLAVSALHKSKLDARPDARARDEAIKLFNELSGTIDIVKALKKDKQVTDEQLFYLGFHFAEEGDPIARELLETVIARGPRTKLAKAAKNKLALEAAE